MDYFHYEGKQFILISNYLASSIIFRAKMAWCPLKDYLINLFVVEDYPDEVVSDNGPLFNSQEFASFLSSQGIVLTHYYLPQ